MDSPAVGSTAKTLLNDTLTVSANSEFLDKNDMPYFPKVEETSYQCQGCGHWFRPSLMSCCVAHTPGTCCHQYETAVLPSVERARLALEFKHESLVLETITRANNAAEEFLAKEANSL